RGDVEATLLRLDPRPLHREAMRVVAMIGIITQILGPAVPMVAGDVRGAAILDRPGTAFELRPVVAVAALDLVRGAGTPEQEAVGKTQIHARTGRSETQPNSRISSSQLSGEGRSSASPSSTSGVCGSRSRVARSVASVLMKSRPVTISPFC